MIFLRQKMHRKTYFEMPQFSMRPELRKTPTKSLPDAARQRSSSQHEQRQTVREQFFSLPEGTPCQLLAGEIIMSPSPIPLHQAIILELSLQLLRFVKEKKAGRVFSAPLDVALDDDHVVQPDILFIRQENLGIIGKKIIEGAPDLVVEVLSPSSAYHDLRTKFRAYERAGVQEYWIVDPERRSMEVYCTSGKKFQLHQEAEERGAVQSVLLAGFSVALDDLFSCLD